MFNPLFDPSSFSDKELQEKINEQSLRISQARSAGMNDLIIGNMQLVLNQCYDEFTIRQGRKEQSSLEDEGPCVFDMNSYLNDNEEDSKKKNESSRKQIYKSGW